MAELTRDQAIEVAVQFHRANRLAEAEAIYRQILEREPNCARALHFMGLIAMQQGHPEDAVALIGRAIAQTPAERSQYVSLASALQLLGRLPEALDAYDRAFSVGPTLLPHEHHARGQVLAGLDRHAEAIEDFRKCLASDAQNPELWHNLADSLSQLNQDDAAMSAYRRAIGIKSDAYASLHNLGRLLSKQRRLPEAIAAFRAAIRVNPSHGGLHWALGMALLSVGDFEAGWKEYEWRWQSDEYREPRRNFAQPRFVGQDVRGKTILIYNEQGFGDAIQFVRYARLLYERGGKVIVACAAELFRLFQNLPGVERTAIETPSPLDLHCPFMSLPLAFQTRLETIPARIPYLSAIPQLRAAWASKLSNATGMLRVGLVWAGRPSHPEDRSRSISFDQLAPLLATPAVCFFTLQMGLSAAQLAESPLKARVIDYTAELHDFADTAALVDHLDLVIAVDTAIAHLAGAMGKPIWVLLPFCADWRWMQDREDSPWYPTMRLFRQTAEGDWASVIGRVAGELASLASATRKI